MTGSAITGTWFRTGFLTRNLYAIMAVCFLAPIICVNSWLGYARLVDYLMGFTPETVTYHSIRGCYTERWMNLVVFGTDLLYKLVWVSAGFRLSRKGYREKSTGLLLAGAVALYPIADRFIWMLARPYHPLWFVDRKEVLLKTSTPVFGNLYVFDWVVFLTYNCLTVGSLFVAYKVVFSYWSKSFRQSVFTWGVAAGGLGWVCWFFWLGPVTFGR